MAVSGTVPAATRARRFDPTLVAGWIRRCTWVLAGACFVWLFTILGTQWVPAGMDTVPGIEPGSWCLVDRRAGAVQVGQAVFATTPDGVLLLSRVAAVDDTSVTVLHPNSDAAFPDSRVFGALPRANLRGVVLVALPPDAPPGATRGR